MLRKLSFRRPQKREAQGVRIIKLDAKDKVTAIAMIEAETEGTE